MPAEKYMLGLFINEDQAVEAVQGLREFSWPLHKVHSPIPSHKLSDALGLKKSPVGLFTLGGGIIGFFTGFLLAIYTALQWNLIVSGKPIVALIPFFIVGFEFTILFAVFGNVIGMLVLSRLPRFNNLELYDPRCSGEHIGILTSCLPEHQNQLAEFFTQKGGEVRVFETPVSDTDHE